MKKINFFLFLPFLAFSFLGFSQGDRVPNFQAFNQDRKVIQLADFKDKMVLVYFYPKDNTKGCTQEACEFRNHFQKFKNAGLIILGVSSQGIESHKQFHTSNHLPFDLLSDEDGKLAELFSVGKWPILSMIGVNIRNRQSFLLNPILTNSLKFKETHELSHFYKDVDPSTHAQEILADLEKLKK